LYLFKNSIWREGHDTKFVSFQKMVDKKKPFFVCVVALPSKRFFFVNHFLKRYFLFQNGFFFLKRYFLFVSWPSLQIPFLLGKSLENFVSLGKLCFPWKTLYPSLFEEKEYIQDFWRDTTKRDRFKKHKGFLWKTFIVFGIPFLYSNKKRRTKKIKKIQPPSLFPFY